MSTKHRFQVLPSRFWTGVCLVFVGSIAALLAFAQIVSMPVLLMTALTLVVLAFVGLGFLGRIRSVRRWHAAVDAYADREIAQSRRLPLE
jgi:cytochrome c biogenesis protein CcdA